MPDSPMTLRNFGGILQLVVTDDRDLAKIDALDAARWAATSAPLRDLHCDEAFLHFVDTESKGRIRVSQLLAARDWLFLRMKERSGLAARSEELVLDALDGTRDEAVRLRRAAEHVIAELQLPEKDKLRLGDVRAFRAGYAKTLANGDGVVPPELLPEPDVAGFARDVLAVAGGAPDASGAQGVGEAQLARFLEGGKAFLAWKTKGATQREVLPLGAATEGAFAAVKKLDAKLEEYFLRCDLLRQEEQTAAALKPTDAEWQLIRARDAAGIEKYLAESPLAIPRATGELSLAGGVNPAYEAPLNDLRPVLEQTLGKREQITRAEWRAVKATFDPFAAWQKEKPPEPFETLRLDALEKHLVGPLQERLRHFIAVDTAAAPELAQVIELEKLILYQRWLIELANNFVNFSAVYNPEKTALVEMGTIVIDGRRLEFCVKVEDRASHRKVASESLIFLVYAQITDQDGKAPVYEVAAPVTSGERGRLRVGKRGIFIDTAGREWDATILEVVENPISIKEAMLAPFRRAQKMISEKIESMAAARQAASEKAMQDRAAAAATLPPGVPAPQHEKRKDDASAMQNLLVGGSIAFAAIGSALAFVISAISSITPLRLVASLLGVVAAVAALSALLGWLKLRRRDMGLLFEAAGWAINTQMKITRRLGVMFTRTPAFPPGTRIDRRDMLADIAEVKAQDAQRARRRRRTVGLLLLVIAVALGVWYAMGKLRR